jgi:hypothetical protein
VAKKLKLTGELARPIVRTDSAARLWLSFSERSRDEFYMPPDRVRRERRDRLERAAIEAEDRRVTEVRDRKLRLLAEQLGAVRAGEIDWCALATALADAFVPGLQATKRARRRRGRPSHKDELAFAVRRKQLENGRLTVQAACRALAMDAAGPWHGQNPDSLAQRVYEANAAREQAKAARSENKHARKLPDGLFP